MHVSPDLLDKRPETRGARKSENGRHVLHEQQQRWRRDRSAGSDASSISPRHPSVEPPPAAEPQGDSGVGNPFQTSCSQSLNPFEEPGSQSLNPFETSGGESHNPFETSFESEATPRVSLVMGEAEVDLNSVQMDSSLTSSYDNMTEDVSEKDVKKSSSNAPCAGLLSPSTEDEAAIADAAVAVDSGDTMRQSCDSLTTLQEALEDYESVMSGKENGQFLNFFQGKVPRACDEQEKDSKTERKTS